MSISGILNVAISYQNTLMQTACKQLQWVCKWSWNCWETFAPFP